jgi:hypothetical protein
VPVEDGEYRMSNSRQVSISGCLAQVNLVADYRLRRDPAGRSGSFGKQTTYVIGCAHGSIL